jgi:dolichol-phosphate mannosyltransferase
MAPVPEIPSLHLDAGRRKPPELAVVIPVYNEQDSIRKVICEWMGELDRWCEDYVVLAINDGSSDRSLEELRLLQKRCGPRLLLTTRQNCGHGQTCLEGYRQSSMMGAQYVFQIDSDGQCDPRYFHRLWSLREQFTVIYGVSNTRSWR